jgi:flagellar assembly protein FliH
LGGRSGHWNIPIWGQCGGCRASDPERTRGEPAGETEARSPNEAELAKRIKQERAECDCAGGTETAPGIRAEAAGRSLQQSEPRSQGLMRSELSTSRASKLEIVQLALAIAAKILHREAQVDPMLVATLVRMAVEKMREGSRVTVRVGPARAQWKAYFASQPSLARVEVVENAELSEHDCLLETELGRRTLGWILN